jgi:hypothetical protein
MEHIVLREIRLLQRAVILTALALSLGACKFRSGSSDTRDTGYTYDNYHGPNMSNAACAADPDKCVCVLDNEYDKDEYRKGPVSDPKRKEWFRQCIGQEVWYKATAGSSRFHQYLAPQKASVTMDWGWVMHTDDRGKRFDNWGIVNDPDCCTPPSTPGGSDGTCPKSMNITKDDTFGWDYCPGDDVLLSHVGDPSKDYTKADPACNISKLEEKISFGVRAGGGDDTGKKRFDSCYLAFGTSTGALGFRKFPNPRFNKERWKKLNDGSASSWANYSRRNPGGGKPDYSDKGGKQRIDDPSVEPPFLVGETCGSCHIGFNPKHPPSDPNKPEWKNVLGAIGNSFLHMTEILGAGVAPGTLEHELFLHARPGTVDTSAITNDFVNNPGTMNAIINFDRRPGVIDPKVKNFHGVTFNRFSESVTTYRQKQDGSWARSTDKVKIPHVLKGGEDSIGPQGAVQRVYINIFSCTETCLANHLDDLRVLNGRGARQTPFELEQCQRDCPGYPAVEDRVWDVIDFLLRVRPTDLKDAKDPADLDGGLNGTEIVKSIKTKKAPGSNEEGSWYEAGKEVFGEKCAKCHSSHPGQDMRAGLPENSKVSEINVAKFVARVDEVDENGVRLDWLGSDVQIPSKLVGTYRCRSLHSNHLEGHLWEAYASDSYHGQDRYAGIDDSMFEFPIEGLNSKNLGGRGFYRNISLLNVWAHAPFMHNNGLGWEWDHPIFDIDRGSPTDWKKLKKNPSVKTRLKMFDESIKRLLSPEDQRERTGSENFKVVKTSADINLVMAPKLPDIPDAFFAGGFPGGSLSNLKQQLEMLQVTLPKGMPVNIIGSIRHKKILDDLMKEVAKQDTWDKKHVAAQKFLTGIFGTGTSLSPDTLTKNLMSKGYVNCGDRFDNRGHEFIDMNDTQKAQLIDFLKTL